MFHHHRISVPYISDDALFILCECDTFRLCVGSSEHNSWVIIVHNCFGSFSMSP